MLWWTIERSGPSLSYSSILKRPYGYGVDYGMPNGNGHGWGSSRAMLIRSGNGFTNGFYSGNGKGALWARFRRTPLVGVRLDV